VDVPIPPKEAVWAQLRLSYEGPDVRGECHFDDLSFLSQPRIEVRPVGRELPVFRPSESVLFRISVPASVPGDPSILISLRDASGRETGASRSLPLRGKEDLTVTFDLPGAGYFELHTRLVSSGTVVSRKITPVLAPEALFHRRREGRAVGVTFNPHLDSYRDPGGLTTLLGNQHAKIVLWDHFGGRRWSEPEPGEIVALIRSALEAEVTGFTAVLARPPPSLFPSADPGTLRDSPLALFQQPKKVWEPGFAATLERYAPLFTDWQLGEDGPNSHLTGGASETTFEEVSKRILAKSRGARVGVPGAAGEIPSASLPGARFFAVSPNPGSGAERYGEKIVAPGNREWHLVAEVPALGADDRDGARRDQAAELLRRLVFAATLGNPAPVYVPISGDPQTGILDTDGYPTAGTLAVRTANDVLSGAKYVPGAPLFPPPIRHFIFEKEGGMTIALWSESGTASVQSFFGHRARLVDPFGSSRAVDSETKFSVGPRPLFIVGADPILLQTQLSVQLHRKVERLDPDQVPPIDTTLPLRADPTVRILRMTNRYPDELRNVSFRILDPLPEGWTMRPREDKISLLRPGESFQRELAIALPPSEQEEVREVSIELSFLRTEGGQQKPYVMRVKRGITLIPEIVVVPVTVTPDRRDPDRRRMTLLVRNRSDHTVNLRGWLRITGRPDEQVSVGGLKPNTEEEIASFEYRATGVHRQSAEIRLEEKGGGRIFLNKTIRLSPEAGP